MEETYLCPDCSVEHTEPVDAVLGHLARCMTCALLLDELTQMALLDLRYIEVRLAA